jgi:hypothetical protein
MPCTKTGSRPVIQWSDNFGDNEKIVVKSAKAHRIACLATVGFGPLANFWTLSEQFGSLVRESM